MKKILCLLLIILLMFSLFAGCAKVEESVPEPEISETEQAPQNLAEGKTVAICMGSVNHPIHKVVQYGFLTKAEELGMNGIVSGADEGSMQELIAIWESAVLSGAEGIALWTGNDSCYDMMKGIKELGVYCVVPHFPHEYKDTKDFIDRNIHCVDEAYIKKAAEFIVNRLQEKGIESGVIGYTANGPGSNQNWYLRDLFAQEIEALGVNYTVAEIVFEGAEINEATRKVTDVILSNSTEAGGEGIVAGFGATVGSPQSWQNAMENTGVTDLVVVGMDYTQININNVKNGYITGLVCQPLIPEMEACSQTLYDLFNGKDYSVNEDSWFLELEAPIASKEGEGIYNINYYQNILDTVTAYFE